jgi:hypothetical protein
MTPHPAMEHFCDIFSVLILYALRRGRHGEIVTPISFHITFLDEKNSSNFDDLHRFLLQMSRTCCRRNYFKLVSFIPLCVSDHFLGNRTKKLCNFWSFFILTPQQNVVISLNLPVKGHCGRRLSEFID